MKPLPQPTLACLLLLLVGCASPPPSSRAAPEEIPGFDSQEVATDLADSPPRKAVLIAQQVAARLEVSLGRWEKQGRPSYLNDEVFWAESAFQPAIGELQVVDIRIGGFEDPAYCALYSAGRQVPIGPVGGFVCCEAKGVREGFREVRPSRNGCAASALRGSLRHASDCLFNDWLSLTLPESKGVVRVDAQTSALRVGENWVVRVTGPGGLPVCLWWLTSPTAHRFPTTTDQMRARLDSAKADEILSACSELAFDPDLVQARFAAGPGLQVCRARLRYAEGWERLESCSFEVGTSRGGFCGGFVDWTGSHRVGTWIATCVDGSCWSWKARASQLTAAGELIVVVLHGGFPAPFCNGDR